MEKRGFRVRGLGEIAIRCGDIATMTQFYETILGLDRMSGSPNDGIVFFRIADGVAGHTTVLALFDAGYTAPDRPGLHPDPEGVPETGARSSLHHIALSLPHDEQEAAMRWYEANSIAYRVEVFDWVGWRGIFTTDPEGNTVELVAHDPRLEDPIP